MADGIFFVLRQLGDSTATAREPKNRVVPKSAVPCLGPRNCPLTLPRAHIFSTIGQNDRDDAGEGSRTIRRVERIDGVEQQPASPCIVEVSSAVACRQDPRRAIERSDRDPRIVCDGHLAGFGGVTPCFLECIGDKGRPILGRICTDAQVAQRQAV